jgi:hypothetical protein
MLYVCGSEENSIFFLETADPYEKAKLQLFLAEIKS